MKLAQHCLSAVPLALAGYAASGGRFSAAVMAGLSSVLIDGDHVLDYLLYRKRWGGTKDFFASSLRTSALASSRVSPFSM